ncbi:MAG: pyruvate:ferredoxin (flavodoxin) oxidoreductase [Chthoniobacterales bacterium]|nr:pyruvate:ferredoxin (flavodoxin) oxidoreductase [Chthoniobacterales bacterium]
MQTRTSAARRSMDGNEAAAYVAYRLSETIALYPITPSTPMGELSDEWASKGQGNLWGHVPKVVEMQSEAGAAGTIHGMLQGGSLATTFTASQGLLLMIPIMYKLAGQLMPFCMHVTARTLATHALSIFGDHSDVMAVRQTGFALLGSASVQEAHDMACIAHASTLLSRVPFLHFFDGFRTSHEINDLELLSDDVLRAMMDEAAIQAHAKRAMTPDRPSIRGTAQNPDAFFQAREAANPFYAALPGIVQEEMFRFASLTGRTYHLFDYTGDPEADRVVVVMGSGGETLRETSKYLNSTGQRTGVLQVRLYRPFDAWAFLNALPETVKQITVLDRTKEPGAPGEPLFLDVSSTLRARGRSRWKELPKVHGGRFGLASKEFTPAMALAIFADMQAEEPREEFTIGIEDDVSGLSLRYDPGFHLPGQTFNQAVFYGLGSDGTVGANKNTIKIIAKKLGLHAQAYFVYDSKKAGAVTVSHLRFGNDPIHAPYLISAADFVGCHQYHLLEQQPVLETAREGATFLLNTPHGPETAWDHLSHESQELILSKKLKFFVIDAYRIAKETGMGARINTIMQVAYFALSDILPLDQAISEIKTAIEKSYARKGADLVQRNCNAVDKSVAGIHEVQVPDAATATAPRPFPIPVEAPDFVREVSGTLLAGRGDQLPVSVFPPDGVWPTGTSKWEKRNLALEIPVWDSAICIQCNKCVLVCPHAAIRAKYYPESELTAAPEGFQSVAFRSPEVTGQRYTIQVAPEDCTGCRLCIYICPAKDKTNAKHKALDAAPLAPLRERERANFAFFESLPAPDRTRLKADLVKDSQFMTPLFEYSGACVGCGETPYVKLMTQMFGDRAIIANATGCSSIYGGNLPTTPYTTNSDGRGPAWANSLFEDNAEFGLGLRLSVTHKNTQARELLLAAKDALGAEFVASILEADQSTEAGIAQQRERVVALREKLALVPESFRARLEGLADYLVKKSVWIMGGDGWAYDIGFGGLDHVLSLGENVNILVLDTEVYSNTGGQQSKATPMGAIAKFAASGKANAKKDLGLYAMSYGNVYVARVAMGGKDSQTLKAFAEAESYPGTSLIIAYSHCIAHGYNLARGLEQQKLAVETGYWPLYRHDPRRLEAGLSPLVLDSPAPKLPLARFTENEIRYRLLESANKERAATLARNAQDQIASRYETYRRMASGGTPEKTS